MFDLLGVGFYGMFAPTAYAIGFMLGSFRPIFANHAFAGVGDVDRYLGLVSDFARLVRQMAERTAGQAERGIVMPRVQLDQAITLMTALKASSPGMLAVDPARLDKVGGADAAARIAARIDARLSRHSTPCWRCFGIPNIARALRRRSACRKIPAAPKSTPSWSSST